jgi:hypothetical protein
MVFEDCGLLSMLKMPLITLGLSITLKETSLTFMNRRLLSLFKAFMAPQTETLTADAHVLFLSQHSTVFQ